MLLTIRDAARQLGLDRRTLSRAIKAGDVPAVIKLGSRYRMDADCLVAWTRGRLLPINDTPRKTPAPTPQSTAGTA